MRKLKKLSAVAFAAQSKTLGYDLLMRELQLASVRELEDLLIDCIYTGLISGRLDQQAGHLDVFFQLWGATCTPRSRGDGGLTTGVA